MYTPRLHLEKLGAIGCGSWDWRRGSKVPAAAKLLRHQESAHDGKADPDCMACKELTKKGREQ